MTLILVDLVDRELVRFDVDPPVLSGHNDFPVARVKTPPGLLVKSRDGTHALRLGGTGYSAAEVLAGKCQGTSVELLLTLSARFVAMAGWERNPGGGWYMGPCPKCWKRNDVARPDAEPLVTCQHCGVQLVVCRPGLDWL